jgi:flagellar motility protein MotE (MotC chaperone)
MLADIVAPWRQRGRRLVLYLSLTLLVPLFVGLAVLLGAAAPAKTRPVSPGAEARGPSPDIPRALREPGPLLTLKADDVPLLKSLRERQVQLDERDKQLANRDQQLANREADLRLVQQQIEDKLTTLALLRKEMGDLLQEKAAFEEKRFEHLVKVYEVMKPEEISSLFERLNEDTAARLLYQMKEKKAGQILASISPQVAAKLSERLAAQRQQEPQPPAVKEKR